MTLINKIREKSGWAIGVVAVALGLFVVGGDLLSPNSAILGEKQLIGEINGEDVGLREFTERVEQIRQNYLNNNITPDENMMPGIRQEAWRQLIFKYAYMKQIEELGIQVTDAELTDMVQGNNIHPSVASSFTNPETGEFDRQLVLNYLQMLRTDPSGMQELMFANFEQSLRQDRFQSKFENLISNTFYVTDAEGQREYEKQNNKFDVRYVYIPYTSIPDSVIDVTDAKLKAYFDKNADKYEQEANRELKYISIPIVATSEDRRNIAASLTALSEQFAKTSNDTAFIEANSEGNGQNFISGNPAQLPRSIEATMLEKGKVYGPYQEGESFKLYKVVDVLEDSVFSTRASHILFKTDNNATTEAKAEVRKQATEVLDKLKREENTFEAMALAYGGDGTRSRGGDLGWFTEGTMVAPFNEAVMKATSLGLIPNLVETEFGFHIVKITGLKTKQKYVIGAIQKDIAPSDQTIDQAYRKAGRFSQYRTQKEFEDFVTREDSTLILYQALTVKEDGRNINNLTQPRVREIIRWAYQAKVGEVSEIYDLDDQYLIVVLTGKSEKGSAKFENVKEQVRQEVLKQEKEKIILEKIGKISYTDLDQLKQGYGPEATIAENNDVSLASSSLNRAGVAPTAIGTISAMKEGQVSKPIAEQNGVLVVEVTKVEPALETADLTTYKNQFRNTLRGSTSFKLREAIEKFSDVKNNISKYY